MRILEQIQSELKTPGSVLIWIIKPNNKVWFSMKYTLILELVLSSSMAFIFTIAGNTAETRANEAHVDAAFSGSSSHDKLFNYSL